MLQMTHSETVACDVAEVEANSTSKPILLLQQLHATLRATISRVDTRCNFQVARDVVGNVASCVRALKPKQFQSHPLVPFASLPLLSRLRRSNFPETNKPACYPYF